MERYPLTSSSSLIQQIPLNTKGDGSCFFHASFGSDINGTYQVDQPGAFRKYWHDFLLQFDSLGDPKMPNNLKNFIRKTFETHISLIGDDMGDKYFNTEEFQKLHQEFIQIFNQLSEQKDTLLSDISGIFKDDDNFKNIIDNKNNIQLLHAVIKKLAEKNNELKNLANLNNDDFFSQIYSALRLIRESDRRLLDCLEEHLEEFSAIYDPNKYTSDYYEKNINNENIMSRFLNSKILYGIYLNAIQQPGYQVFMEEIPVLATLFKKTITIWYSDNNNKQTELIKQVFTPDAKLSEWVGSNNNNVKLPKNLKEFTGGSVDIYHNGFDRSGKFDGFHYSRADNKIFKKIKSNANANANANAKNPTNIPGSANKTPTKTISYSKWQQTITNDLKSYLESIKSDASEKDSLPSVRKQIMQLGYWQDKKIEEIRTLSENEIDKNEADYQNNIKNLDPKKPDDLKQLEKFVQEKREIKDKLEDDADQKTNYINELIEEEARKLIGWIVEVGIKKKINDSEVRRQKAGAIVGLVTALVLAGITVTKQILSITQPDDTQANQITEAVNTFIGLASAAILGYLSNNINRTANNDKKKREKELGKYENEVSQASLLSKFGLTKAAKEDIDLEKGTQVLQPKTIKFM